MPNTFAYVALFSWPVVVFFLYRRLPRAEALIAAILGGYLLLPYGVGIDPPVLPTFDKTLIPALSALVMALVLPASPGRPAARRLAREGGGAGHSAVTRQHGMVAAHAARVPPARSRRPLRPRQSRICTALLVLLFFSPFVTVLQNPDPYDIGPRVLPGLRLYDAFSMGLDALVVVLPYLLARHYLATPQAHRLLLRGLVLWGLVYSLPALFEIRMSPQLARWTYGFLAQPFGQTMRDGGFRPVVFLQHGLWLAIFLAMAVLAAAVLWRGTRGEGDRGAGRWLLALAWLLGTLVLCKSAGALVIAVLALIVLLVLPVRGQLILASLLAGVILTYPALRGADLIPVDRVVSLAEGISADRAGSLEFRLKNEDQLLAHARLKPLAGWGGWGRSRIYDPESGKDISVTDGAWIIIVGVSGWLGYVAKFGLLLAPIFLLAWRRKRLGVDLSAAGLAMILVVNLSDMIPNATLTPVTWLIAGALMGRQAVGRVRDSEPPAPRQAVRSARSG